METKRGILLVLLAFALIFPLVSAGIVINTQPAPVYNLGDISTTKVTFKPAQAVSGNFQMDLLCGGNQVNFYRNGINVAAGDEKIIESSLILTKDIIGNSKGTCKIKAYIGSDFMLTNEFLISDLIIVNSTLPKTDFAPGESILVKGTAIKENGNASNGYVEVSLIDGNTTVSAQKGTVNNGAFSISMAIPTEIKSGNYALKAVAYEEDVSGQATNTGYFDNAIFVKQVPTSLEIVFAQQENGTASEISPGETLKVKAVLHDQTGVGIASDTFLTIKNSNNKIIEQQELPTDEFLEFPITYYESPSAWKVVAVSNKLTTEASFNILEKEDAIIEIMNKTVLITNIGNVPYNKTILVKIGNQTINIGVYLKVKQSKMYVLTAPDGEYAIEVNADGTITGSVVSLTGTSVDVKEASGGFVKFSIIWIFMIAVLGVMTFIVFKRGYQKAFIGYITGAPRRASIMAAAGSGAFGIAPRGKAEMVLSIKGDKQEASMLTLKIKNLAWIKNMKESSASETLEKINDFAEGNKAAVYDNGENIFFIFAPARTKTFKNEPGALQVAKEIKEMLDHHNKMFRQKIDFGISLNTGEIIAKQDSESFKFMGMGNLMNSSKKIASLAENDILMGEKITDKLKAMVKTEKHEHEGTKVYSIKEIRDSGKHDKFLQGFMKRQGEGK